MKETHKLVIGGGGFGGLKLALELANNENFEIKLVSDKSSFEYHAALYRSATGRSPLEVVLPLSGVLHHAKNVEIVLDKIASVDQDKKLVVCENGDSYMFDSLVLALGQVTNYYGIEGMEENSYSLDTVSKTIKLRHHLHDMVLDDAKDSLKFVVVGAGASGTELSAEMGYYIKRLARAHNMQKKKFEVVLVEGSDRLLPLLSKRISQKAYKRLSNLGVKIYLNTIVKSMTLDEITTDAVSLKTHTVVWTAGAKTNQLYSRFKRTFNLAKNGRVKVDDYLQANKDIYVIGDNADTKYSGMAQTALYDAGYIAHNLRRKSLGHQPLIYKPKRPIYVVPAGGAFALLQWGGFVSAGKLAWILRRLADLRLFSEFQPFKKAVKTWRAGNRRAIETCDICGKHID
jgi:NADH dehydrogenase